MATEGKKGKQAQKHVLKGIVCPHCAKTFDQHFMRVVDKPGQPAVAHFQAVSSEAGADGLFDGEEPESERPEVKARG